MRGKEDMEQGRGKFDRNIGERATGILSRSWRLSEKRSRTP